MADKDLEIAWANVSGAALDEALTLENNAKHTTELKSRRLRNEAREIREAVAVVRHYITKHSNG